MAAPVVFDVTIDIERSPRQVWDALIDWCAHAEWVPLTRVDIEHEEPGGIGTIFTAWTGVGPLKLEDRMEVTELRWDDDTSEGFCEVRKLGPTLDGRASFRVRPGENPVHTEVTWNEDLMVDMLPKPFGMPVAKVSALGFRLVVGQIAKTIESSGELVP